jgi:signal-transduction protein with cAMP-binding, CBS, and nucleotidyltransferase domain
VIRTREGRIRPLTAFEAVPFVHSGTPPGRSLAADLTRAHVVAAIRAIVGGSGTVDAKRLERVPLFAGLSQRDREQVARRADTVDIPAGRHLLDEGRLPHEFFVILDGEVEVTHEGSRLATLGPGDFFGEIALIEHSRRTASVVTTAPTTLAVMSPPAFDAVRREMPAVADRIAAAIKERLAR